jgi:hypothetical protein
MSHRQLTTTELRTCLAMSATFEDYEAMVGALQRKSRKGHDARREFVQALDGRKTTIFVRREACV